MKSTALDMVSTVAGWMEPLTHLTRMWTIGAFIAGVLIFPFDAAFGAVFIFVSVLFAVAMCTFLAGDKFVSAVDLA